MEHYKRLLKKKEVAECLGCSDYALQKWVNEGKIKPIRIGRCLRFHPNEVKYIMENGLRKK